MVTEEQILEALKKVMDPELKQSLVDLGMVRKVEIRDAEVNITLALTTLACPLKDDIVQDTESAVKRLDGVKSVQVHLEEMTDEERARALGSEHSESKGMAAHLNKIDRVIAVMSGKGGVGKSLVTGMLAVELRRRGHRVGILDADITGPSIPKMFGLQERPSNTPLGIRPVRSRTGIPIMSINLLLPHEDDAVIWRGPLIAGAIKQFWGDVFWGDLDYLLVDLPPGTADAPLTVMQSLPLNGIVLVTSPQDLAGMVVRKAAQMALQLHIPILGVVENMSYAVCPHCGERHDIFGPSHAEEVAALMSVPMLGQIPLDSRIATLCDEGKLEDYELEDFQSTVESLLEKVPERASTPLFL